MRTTTERLFSRLTTRTREPKGSVGWQAVIAFISKISPLAVWRPLNTPPYQEAIPCNASAERERAVIFGASEAGVALEIGSPGGAVATGLGSSASACTAGIESVTTTAAIRTEQAPASNQIRTGDFTLMLRVFHNLTICPFY
jgi:hypothetical protein